MNLSELPEAITTMQAQIKELQEIVARHDCAPILTGTSSQMDIICNVVAKHFSITVAELKSRTRSNCIVWPRMLATHLIRQKTKYTLNEIGKCFFRDHGTVLNACMQVQNRIGFEPSYKKEVEHIAATIDLIFNEKSKA